MKKLLQIILVIAFLSFISRKDEAPTFQENQDPRPKGKKWVKVDYLCDEFNGSELDMSKWQKEPVGNDWGWIGRPPGLFKASNVKVDDGKLKVTVGKLDAVVEIDHKKFTHQGGIVRALKPGHVGWYFECKMKANKTVMSSTFWLMSKYNCEKKEELDIQECVGRTSELTKEWAKDWNRIFHSNAIHRKTDCLPKSVRDEDFVKLDEENHERYYVYGAWWKSPTEILCYLDGKFMYKLNPTVAWDTPAFIHMAIETYNWNPIPKDGGLVESGTLEERTTKYEWVRTWKLE